MFYYEIGSLNKLLFIIIHSTRLNGTGKKKLSSNAVIILCFHFFCRYLEYYKKIIIESSDDHYPINYKSNFIYAKRKKQNKKMPYNTFDLKL